MTESTETFLAVLINRDGSKMKIISKPGMTPMEMCCNFCSVVLLAVKLLACSVTVMAKDVLLEAKKVNIYYITFQGKFPFPST